MFKCFSNISLYVQFSDIVQAEIKWLWMGFCAAANNKPNKMWMQRSLYQLTFFIADKVKSGKLQKRVVEKIEMGDVQFQMREKVLSTSSRPFKACAATGRPSDVFKPCAPSGRPSDVFRQTAQPRDALKPITDTGPASDSCGGQRFNPEKQRCAVSTQSADSLSEEEESIFYGNKENFSDTTVDSDPSFALPQGRKVSMADDVKVIYADGEESIAMLSSKTHPAGRSEIVKKKKQPKSTKNVKHVTADEAPQYECKTQWLVINHHAPRL